MWHWFRSVKVHENDLIQSESETKFKSLFRIITYLCLLNIPVEIRPVVFHGIWPWRHWNVFQFNCNSIYNYCGVYRTSFRAEWAHKIFNKNREPGNAQNNFIQNRYECRFDFKLLEILVDFAFKLVWLSFMSAIVWFVLLIQQTTLLSCL